MRQLLHGIPVVIAVFLMAQPARAYDFIKDGVCYDFLDSETCRISGYDRSNYPTELIIPETVSPGYSWGNYNYYRVVEIGEKAFEYASNLTKIVLPPSISIIPDYAFHSCSELQIVEIKYEYTGNREWDEYEGIYRYDPELPSEPIGIESIGAHAFDGCSSLTDLPRVNITSTMEYEDLPSLIPERKLKSIGEYAFYKCSSLTSVIKDYDNEFVTIGDYAFANCGELSSWYLPTKNIPEYAFYEDKKLGGFHAGSSIESIGDYAFYNCIGMYQLDLSFGSSLKSIGQYAFFNVKPRDYSKTLVIPENVSYIGERAFATASGWGIPAESNDMGIHSVRFMNKMGEIPVRMFEGRTRLKTVTFPESASVTSVGKQAFKNCPLDDFDFSNIVSIGDEAFYGADFKEVKLPASLTTLGKQAFSYCELLEKIDISAGIVTLSEGLFSRDSKLTTVKLPSTLTQIENSAFSGCSALTSIKIKASTPPTATQTSFSSVAKDKCTVYVPSGCVDAYKAKAYWKTFKYIFEEDDALIPEQEWQLVRKLKNELVALGWECPWDVSGDAEGVESISEITVRDNHIVKVDLASKGLAGEFPWSILEFPQMKIVVIDSNSLTGDFSATLQQKLLAKEVVTDSLRTLKIDHNNLSGNLATVTNNCPALKYLYASYNCFSEIFPAIENDMSRLEYSHQTIDKTVTLNLADFNPGNLMNEYPSILLYNPDERLWNKAICFDASVMAPYADDPDTNFAVRIMSLDKGALQYTLLSENRDYHGASGDVLNVATRDQNGDYNSSFKIKLVFGQGDADFSGRVDIADLQAIINRIKDVNKNMPFNFTASDLYPDGRMTVQDVVKEVDMLLAQPQPGSAPSRSPFIAEIEDNPAAELNCDGNALGLRSEVPVAAFDIYVEGAREFSPSQAVSSRGFVCVARADGRGLRVIGYSLDEAVLEGDITLGTIVGDGFDIIRAELVDDTAQKVPSVVADAPAGVSDVRNMNGILTQVCADGLKVSCTGEKDLRWSVAAVDGRALSSGTLSLHDRADALIPLRYDGIVIVTIRDGKNSITQKIDLRKR